MTEDAWRPVPSTGTPMMSAPCFSGSSSRKPLTSYWLLLVGVDFMNQFGARRAGSIYDDSAALLPGTLPEERPRCGCGPKTAPGSWSTKHKNMSMSKTDRGIVGPIQNIETAANSTEPATLPRKTRYRSGMLTNRRKPR